MNSNLAADELDLTRFALNFLEANGAALEENKKTTSVLLPEKLCDSLNVEEYILITPDDVVTLSETDSEQEQNLHKIQFGSPLLDRIVFMAGSKPPILNVSLKFSYIKTQGFENLINEQFEFHKCKPKITGAGETTTQYIFLTCQFTAQSDEQKQGLIDFAFNTDTNAYVPDMLKMLTSIEKEYKLNAVSGYTKNQIKQIHNLVELYGYNAVSFKLENFIASMKRRFKRDNKSLDEYYKALEKEMRENLKRAGISNKLIKERKEKIAMLPQELATKKKDLLNKYSINIDFSPVAAMTVDTPCVKLFVTLIAGRKKHDITIIYNPGTKKADPIVCRSCGISTYSFGLCSNMHINCPNCLTKGCTAC